MSRLRKHFKPIKIRFFASGEYGKQSNTERPHYHLLLFGIDFDDKIHCRTGKKQEKSYSSKTLDKIWGKGRTEVSDLNYTTAAYVARYVMKKITGNLAEHAYTRHDEFGELYELTPEFGTMSVKPGLGYTWLVKYASDIFPCDHVIIAGKHHPVPPYYFRKLGETDGKIHRKIQLKKKMALLSHKEDNTPARLKVREKVQSLKLNQLKRNLSQ